MSWTRRELIRLGSAAGLDGLTRSSAQVTRNMYMQGNRQYEYHVKTYGHPSKFGYKDTIPLWKAERFDPAALQCYVRAGAKYFVRPVCSSRPPVLGE